MQTFSVDSRPDFGRSVIPLQFQARVNGSLTISAESGREGLLWFRHALPCLCLHLYPQGRKKERRKDHLLSFMIVNGGGRTRILERDLDGEGIDNVNPEAILEENHDLVEILTKYL